MSPALNNVPLFAGVSLTDQRQLESRLELMVRIHKKGEQIAICGEIVQNLLIVLEGSVTAEMADSTGKTIRVEELGPNSLLAPAFLFGKKNRYPVDVLAKTKVKLAVLPKGDLLLLLAEYPVLLSNFLDLISNRAQFLTEKLKMLSFQSLRGKMANYILQIVDGRAVSEIRLPRSQADMAEMFGVTRPAVGRILRKMDEEGYFKTSGRQITEINLSKLKDLIR